MYYVLPSAARHMSGPSGVSHPGSCGTAHYRFLNHF
jgi:hypothetical protein